MKNRVATLGVAALLVLPTAGAAQTGATDGQWPHYAGDKGSTKYAALNQIDRSNVGRLREAWRWTSVDESLERRRGGGFKVTPIVADGVMYTSTAFSQVAAIDPATGETLWVYDPQSYLKGRPPNSGFQHRGVDYWTDGEKQRILIATGGHQLISIDTKTGMPDPAFGNGGIVDLEEGLGKAFNPRFLGFNAPPVVARDTIVLGSIVTDGAATKAMPPGHIRGYDVRTGEQKWIFHTIPQAGEFGNDTWFDESWEYSGNTNAWSMLSVDEELGYVYIPLGTPTSDYYGGFRHGDNLFAESLLCLDAETGKRVWHFQMVHHGLWDYDLPAAPNLVDIVVDGRAIKAVAQVSKQGYVYVFDRVTGEPVWPIEERPVPQTTTPGEWTANSQPHPTKPPAFERQGVTVDDLIDFTPELRQEAERILAKYTPGPLFTPPTVVTDHNLGTAVLPSAAGGANWMGASIDPETAILYVPSMTNTMKLGLRKNTSGRSEFPYLVDLSWLPGPQGLPLVKPPYGRITAIDLNRGEIVWQVPHGDGPRDHPAIRHLSLGPLGAATNGQMSNGGGVLTRELLFMIQPDRNPDPEDALQIGTQGVLRAFDKTNGEELWEYRLDKVPHGTPMTYMHTGRQYLVVAIGGRTQPPELVAFTLQ